MSASFVVAVQNALCDYKPYRLGLSPSEQVGALSNEVESPGLHRGSYVPLLESHAGLFGHLCSLGSAVQF